MLNPMMSRMAKGLPPGFWRRSVGWKLSICLATSGFLATCTPGPALYFPADAANAPVINRLLSDDPRVVAASETALSQFGTAGGARIVLEGLRLDTPSLSVRFGEQQAVVDSVSQSEGVTQLVVMVPNGPLEGGTVALQVTSDGGLSEVFSYTYAMTDDPVFANEVGSLALVGEATYGDSSTSTRAVEGVLRFWPAVRPRAVTGLIETGSLYYLPADLHNETLQGEPLAWQPYSLFPLLPSGTSVAAVNQVLLTPQDSSSELPFVFSWESIHRTYQFCQQSADATALWQPGSAYRLELSGGVLPTPVRTDLQAPPGFLPEGETFFTLQPDETGVGTINRNLDLRLELQSVFLPIGAAAYLMAELVVTVPSLGMSNQPRVLERVSLEAMPDSEQLRFSTDVLSGLSEVNTTCARLGVALERARLGAGGDEDQLETQYLNAGCTNPSDPTSAYRAEAELRLSRHAVYAVPLETGIAGCPSPGSCDTQGRLLVDLVTVLRVPVNIADLPVSECVDFVDNDQDGLTDALDPGCQSNEDTSEQDENLVCDDGLDNDGDGRKDFRVSGQGDPGCSSPSDNDERGTGACDDGKDNDGDGTVDFVLEEGVGDPGCVSVNDISENEPSLICDDGKDNDNDNRTDFKISPGVGDPGCSSPSDPTDFDETGTWVCDDRIDNDGDGTVDTEDNGCKPGGTSQHSPYEVDEFNPVVECDDGVDNDRDDQIDYRVSPTANGDKDCKNNSDTSELR